MNFSGAFLSNTRLRILCCFFITLAITGQPMTAAAENPARNKFQSILHDSLTDIWTGQNFSPELKQRQPTLKTMLENGVVSKVELENALETSILSLMDRQRTSRYLLKTFPERSKNLFSSRMNWNEIKEVIWRALSSAIKKDDPIFMRVGTLAPPGTPWLSVPETIGFPEIERLSDGKILTKIYGGGVMGEDTDVLEKMAAGQLDTCGCTALGVLEACPEASVLLQPGLFRNYAEVDFICSKFRKRLDTAFEKQGNMLLALIDTGNFYLFSHNKITDLTDLKRQKVITWFGVIEEALYQELGIIPVRVGAPDTVSAFTSGKADTNMAPAAWMLGMQAYQYVNYYLKPPLLYSPAAVIVGGHMKAKIQKQTGMSPVYAHNIMELLIYEWQTLEKEWKRQIRSYEEKSLKAFETKCDMKSVTLPPEDLAALERANMAVQQKLSDNVFSKDLIDDIQKTLEEYRTSH